MLLPRFLAILIIGGGYFVWNMIFQQYPLTKIYEEKPFVAWGIAFAIIIGQLYYIWFIFSHLFSYGDSLFVFFLVIRIVISALILLLLWKKYRG
ncbi:MAG: hypothetical protein P9M11_04060 [Candidatus Tenebribacter burtonii]|jgi:hypothetical protein|nr:hypothetical protein [Candidatus Tenebribacter burtonii]